MDLILSLCTHHTVCYLLHILLSFWRWHAFYICPVKTYFTSPWVHLKSPKEHLYVVNIKTQQCFHSTVLNDTYMYMYCMYWLCTLGSTHHPPDQLIDWFTVQHSFFWLLESMFAGLFVCFFLNLINSSIPTLALMQHEIYKATYN